MVFHFRYAHEGVKKRAQGLVGCSPRKFYFSRASEMPFPMFSWGKVHNQSKKKRLLFRYVNNLKVIFLFYIFEVRTYVRVWSLRS